MTFSKARAVKRGQRSGQRTSTAAASSSPAEPGSCCQGGSASGAPVAACSSRATPYMPRQSGRFGVISSSSTSVTIGSTSASGVPAANSASSVSSSSTMIPALRSPWGSSSSSEAARIIPSETIPRSLAFPSFVPPGITAPGRATATVCPAATFGAPHTIVAGSPSPRSTEQTLRRSASGCCSALSTRPTHEPLAGRRPGVVDRLDLGAGHGEPLLDARGVQAGVAVLAQPWQRGAHQNCSRKRRSFSNMTRRSGTPCLSIAMRSTPSPQAKPCTFSGS